MTSSIGSATMDKDGTIHLKLRAEAKDGSKGDASFTYKRGEDHYDEVLQHLGGITPGEIKEVPPWPES